jgi:serine/threonine-protein kinase
MAEVFRGRDERLARDVAIKVLAPDKASDPTIRRRFATEGRTAARLSHPNVVGVYDVGEDGGNPYLVMELVTGGTLADRIRTGPLGEDVVGRVGLDILAGLGAAHAAGIIHRDVKPGNVLMTENGTAKLADFGIAKAAEPIEGDDATTRAMVIGTPNYLAPERAEGDPASVASDLWAVGVVLYEALAGVKPFQAPTPLAVVLAARNGDVVPLTERRPDVGLALVGAVQRALRPDPVDRFPSAAAMAAALEGRLEWGAPAGASSAVAGLAAVPTAATPPAPTQILEQPAVPRRFGGGRARVALAATVVLAALVTWGVASDSHGASPTRFPPTTVRAPVTTTAAAPTTPPSTTTLPQPAPPHGDRGPGKGGGGKGGDK